MAELAVFILCICTVLLLVFGNPLGRGPNPGDPNDLDDTFVKLKAEALTTDARVDELDYRHLLYRIDGLVGQFMERHMHLVLGAEVRTPDMRRALGIEASSETASPGGLDLSALRHAELGSCAPDVLVYLCFQLYLGGNVKDIGRVQSDPELMLRILQHLVVERDHPPAKFFMGCVMKYGPRADLPGDAVQAGKLLREARREGVGAAEIELRQLRKYAKLRGLQRTSVPVTAPA
jgi:hypothetical protein